MLPRTRARLAEFPVQICQAPIPAGAKSVAVDGSPLPLPSPRIRRIAVVGDTGCRIESGPEGIQACNLDDANGWPFPRLMRSVAAADPDLIIHVGDYVYRREPCPNGESGCAGSPYGNNWRTWDVDFFRPAAAAFSVAPWLFVRGNHENCNRGWRGWFLALDPHDLPESWDGSTCKRFTEPYTLRSEGFDLVVMDSATVPDEFAPTTNPVTVDTYAAQFNDVAKLVGDTPTWFVNHRPAWGVATFAEEHGVGVAQNDPTMAAAVKASELSELPASVRAYISGHMHTFQYMAAYANRPDQVIVGSSGTKLDPTLTRQLIAEHATIFEHLALDPANLTIAPSFAFALLEEHDDTWRVSVRDLNGGEIATAPLAGFTP